MNEGLKIEGWGLRPKRAQRVWKNIFEVMNTRMGKVLLSTELVSPAQAEKILKQRYKPELIEEFFKANVVSVSSGMTLAQTTDDYAERDLESLFGEL